MTWAIVGRDGRIAKTDSDWAKFNKANGGDLESSGIGSSYLDVCVGSPVAELVGRYLRDVLKGERDGFQVSYSCHGPKAARFFRLHAVGVEQGKERSCLMVHQLLLEIEE